MPNRRDLDLTAVRPSHAPWKSLRRGLLGLGLAASISAASAVDATFTGTGVGANWFTPGNWSTGAVPISTGTATVNGGLDALVGSGTGSASSLIVASGAAVTVSGSGVRLNITGTTFFGQPSTTQINAGAFTVTNGALVTGTFAAVDIGHGGASTLTVSNSGTYFSGLANMGIGAGDSGTVLVTGTNSLWHAEGGINLGVSGTGSLTISNGAQVVAPGFTQIGSGNGGSGTVTVSGTGSILDSTGNTITVGSGSGSVGTLYVSDGGLVTTMNIGSAPLYIGSDSSTGTVIQTGGTVSASDISFGTGTSTYRLEGGTLSTVYFNDYGGNYLLELAGGTIQSLVFNSLEAAANATLRAGTVSSIDTNGSSGTWSGVLSGSGGLNKIGASTLVITASNSYSGGTTVTTGGISAGNNQAFGTGGITFVGNSSLQASGAVRTLANNVVINSGITGTVAGNTGLTLTGVVSGSGTLAKAGTGTLTLSGSNTYTGGTTLNAGAIALDNDYALGSGTLTFGANSSVLSGAAAHTVANDFAITAAATTGTFGGAQALTVSGKISGAGGLAKIGTGTLTLSGSNSYTGNTTLTAGTLRLANQNAVVNSSTLVFNGGTLTGNGTAYTLANRVSLAANSAIAGASDLTFSGNVGMGSTNRTLTITNTGTTLFSGSLIGTAGFTKAGAGVLTLRGANTYTGTTTISAGVLDFGAGSLSTGAVVVNGGELRWAGGNTNTMGNNVALGASGGNLNTNGNNVTLTGTLGGSGSLVKSGGGVLTLSATSNSTAARYSVFEGTLRLGANGALAGSKQLVIGGTVASGTTTMDLNGFNLTVSSLTFGGTTAATQAGGIVRVLNTNTGTLTLAGDVNCYFGNSDDLDPSKSVISGNVALGSATRTFFVQQSTQATGAELQVNAVVSGAGGVLQSGFGTMAMNAANTYTGTTTIFSGILSVTNLANGGTASSIGASSNAASNLIIKSGTLRYTGTGGSTDRLFTFGDPSVSGTSSGLDASGSGAIAFTNTGTVTSFANRTATLVLTGTNTGDNILAAAYSDNFFTTNSLEKDGIGKWILTGSNNYKGGTTLNAGTLGLGSADALSGTGAIAMNGGTLQFSSSNTTDYSSRFSTAASQQYKIDTNGQSVTFASSLTSVGGSLTKYGAGLLTLTGSNSYDGGTIVQSGTLKAGNNSAVGSGAVMVNGGVFLVDVGVTVNNSVTVNSGTYARTVTGDIAGAVNATSDISGGVDTTVALLAGTVSSPTTLVTSFAAASSATNDSIRRSDVYSFQGTGTDIFTLQLSFTATSPDSYLGWLSGNQWINAIDGNTGNNATLAQQGYLGSFAAFQALYGNDLSLYLGAWGIDTTGGTTKTWAVLNHNSDFAVVPEPSTCGLLAAGLLGFLVLRRLRLKKA